MAVGGDDYEVRWELIKQAIDDILGKNLTDEEKEVVSFPYEAELSERAEALVEFRLTKWAKKVEQERNKGNDQDSPAL